MQEGFPQIRIKFVEIRGICGEKVKETSQSCHFDEREITLENRQRLVLLGSEPRL